MKQVILICLSALFLLFTFQLTAYQGELLQQIPLQIPLSISTLSNPPYFDALRAAGILSIIRTDRSGIPTGQSVDFDPMMKFGRVRGPLSFPFLIDPKLEFTHPVDADFNNNSETAVIALDLGSTTYTSTAYIKDLGGFFRNHFSWSTDLTLFNIGEFPRPPEYNRSADPFLAENPFTDGQNPKRMYCSGILYNGFDQFFKPIMPDSVAVWYSDNGGQSWSSPPTIVARNDDPNWFFDKPDVEVSWNAGADRGYVYVTFVKVFQSPVSNSQLVIRRSTDGGLTFPADSERLIVTGDVQAPQVLIGPFGGTVYVIYLDYQNNQIKEARSTDYSTWSFSTVANVTPVDRTIRLNGSVRALTAPMARYNSVANKIDVVWHQLEPGSENRTDVWFNVKTALGWGTNPKCITCNGLAPDPGDQFFPALDFDRSGNLKIVWYDRRDDPNNLLYHQYVTATDSDGNLLQGKNQVSTFQSNPQNRQLGDYQDMWFWTYGTIDRFISSWIGIPGNSQYVYDSSITP
ncbi:MAG TPA: hypothetical protein VGQ81_16480 [Acidobacteriota bacterium]|nr:hypothetical protein [Acidobacteriota bacterium]